LFGAKYPQGANDCDAGDCHLLASCGIQVVLALEIVEIRRLIREMSIANPLWERRGSMASCSSWASRSVRPASPSTWPGEEVRRPRAGRPSSAIMPPASRRWICSSCRRFPFGCVWGPVDHGVWHDGSYGWASRRIRPRNGSPTTEACGREQAPRYFIRDEAPMVRSSSEDSIHGHS
jgi:hypothetical protein